MSRTVHCIKLGTEAEALDKAPYPGELGERLLAQVSKTAWREWLAHQTLIINENRLNPRDAKTREFLRDELERYFFGEGSAKPAGYVPPEA
jgi:Fe-S cluster biosynthesis and repair protein YggX